MRMARHGGARSYLVMEFVEGRTCARFSRIQASSACCTARLVRQLASALDAIHAQDVCHRDVKGENIIVSRAGAADEESVLIDISIAIVNDANETQNGMSRAAGSFDYMAPEQAVGYAEPSSDVYSLAKLLLEMLTGRQLKDLLPDAALDLPERVRVLGGKLAGRLLDASIEMLAKLRWSSTWHAGCARQAYSQNRWSPTWRRILRLGLQHPLEPLHTLFREAGAW